MTIKAIENMLRACVTDFGDKWDDYLPLVVFFLIITTIILALECHNMKPYVEEISYPSMDSVSCIK